MSRIVIHEVGLRDGLQMEARVVPTETKLRWLERLVASGVDIVQVGSFVHPTKVPQMADTDALFPQVPRGKALLSALVLNEKGLERGEKCGVDLYCMGVSASETHSRKNTGMGVVDATTRIIAMAKQALAAGKAVQVSVQSAFGCGFEGHVPPENVLRIARAFVEAGLGSLSLADTAGHAVPDAVESLFGAVLALAPGLEATAHFHDTYGLGIANCYAALRAGVTALESSVSGLGGCPFTAVAGGNVCTEDLVHALQRGGVRPDIALAPIVEVAREIASYFGRDMPGKIYRTGPIGAPRSEGGAHP
ncbi:MAG: hydroxymethylglutaryl-CoA lyase [Polyangiaceae bacterium]|nr:hydroxymethylglutaryl-CoA lyase [Polyangiaceae bacterium]